MAPVFSWSSSRSRAVASTWLLDSSSYVEQIKMWETWTLEYLKTERTAQFLQNRITCSILNSRGSKSFSSKISWHILYKDFASFCPLLWKLKNLQLYGRLLTLFVISQSSRYQPSYHLFSLAKVNSCIGCKIFQVLKPWSKRACHSVDSIWLDQIWRWE